MLSHLFVLSLLLTAFGVVHGREVNFLRPVTFTVWTATSIVTVIKTKSACASLVGVTGVCSREMPHAIEASPVLKMETTATARIGDFKELEQSSGTEENNSGILNIESSLRQGKQIESVIIPLVLLRNYLRVVARTVIETQSTATTRTVYSTTTQNSFIVSGCTPPDFKFSICNS